MDKVPAFLAQSRIIQRARHWRMRHVAAIGWMLAFAAVADADNVVVKGELSFSSEGVGKVSECGSGRIFTMGVMATDPYLRLVQGYWRSSYHGKTPVVIKVRGDAERTTNTTFTLQEPYVISLVSERCSD